ncbi:glucan biosynthesis protein [Sphingomonas sp. YR710]|uniref:glucan biosynthesis protein n=1 Tax=Sphingomonas sp. YR710 TaxID=1882773 RepID=UPI00210BD5A8|nr:glucan biosynthesis protein [Sphingomonas sp. YR710]
MAMLSAAWIVAARSAKVQAATGAGQPFSWDWLIAHARTLAHGPAQPLPGADPAAAAIDYDDANRITFRPERTIGPDDGYAVRLFPLIKHAPVPVEINIVDRGVARRIMHAADMFAVTPGSGPAPHIPAGIAGLRIMARGGKSDWLAFQGASYFRSAGALDQYGLSARGLAIDAGIDGREEFPVFTRFWIERGADKALTLYALLEGTSVMGVYRFVNRNGPGGVTQDVSMRLWLRKDIERLGIAPLTSMFWYDEGNRAQGIDWRPEIHDSDRLVIHNHAGERICRPLGNPPHPTINSFIDTGTPEGFGLLQRDRNFDHYQDDGVFYEKRPSLWVEPIGDWGAGAVTLYEIPTTREYEDNVVAFWTPAAPARKGAELTFDYRLRWIATEPDSGPLARVVDRWTGTAGRPGTDPIQGARRLVVDFEGAALQGLTRDSDVVPDVAIDSGRVLAVHTYPVVGRKARWRLIVDLTKSDAAVNVRATLRMKRLAISETLISQFY